MVRILVVFQLLIIAAPASGDGFARVGSYAFSYDGLFTGTRQTSLGQADMAGAAGPDAIQLNTAPLPIGDGVEGAYARNDYLLGIDLIAWGGAAEFAGWRLGFSQVRLSLDPELLRTAYDPEGPGEVVEAGEEINTVSVGFDLGRLVDDTRRWTWTLGAAWRGYDSHLAESRVRESTFDLGSTVAWSTPHPQGRARLAAGISWQNVFATDFVFDGREASLPRSVRAGVTLESTFGEAAWGGEAFRALMAFSYRINPESWLGTDTDHFGCELVAAGVLAGRIGYSSRLPGGVNSWGFGLILDRDFMGPLMLAADYGEYETVIEWLDMWSVRARYSF